MRQKYRTQLADFTLTDSQAQKIARVDASITEDYMNRFIREKRGIRVKACPHCRYNQVWGGGYISGGDYLSEEGFSNNEDNYDVDAGRRRYGMMPLRIKKKAVSASDI